MNNRMIPSPLRYCSPVLDHELTFEQNQIVEDEIAAILRRSSPNIFSFKGDSPYEFDELNNYEEFGDSNLFTYGNERSIIDEYFEYERCSNPGIRD